MALQVQLRRDLAATWVAANPILAQGEVGCELDTNAAKIGNGTDAWVDLPYWPTVAGGGVAVSDDVNGLLDGGATFPRLSFHGKGVLVTGYTHGTSIDISIPGLVFWDENVPLGGTPHTVLNFVGDGVTVVDNGAGKATVLVPGAAGGTAKALIRNVGYAGGSGSDYTMNPALPLNAIVTKVAVKVTTPFNGTVPAYVVIRYVWTMEELMGPAQNDLSVLGVNITTPYLASPPANGSVHISLNYDANCTQGQATVYVEYIVAA